MTLQEFNRLDAQSKKVVLFEANKVAERQDGDCRYELFSFSNFFIEIKTSRHYTFKRTITTYRSEEVPANYRLNQKRSFA
ncbi:MAG TPA: hypothetical protein VF610_02665 [Segetibacter sp.]|jgi:hypothetical protein